VPVVTASGRDAERERTSVTRGLHERVVHSCSAALFALLLAQASAADPIRLLLVGDSITYGVSSGPAGPGYAEALSDSIVAIPEPSTGLLVTTGLLGLAIRRRRAV